jgi:uncharacterized membrane protein YdjX (TVP38/TMEM64 family)
MSLAGGILNRDGVALVSATLGTTFTLQAALYLFREALQRCVSDRLEAINKGLERDGAFYLFFL